MKIKRVPHTLILDRGRIVQASTQQLTLREADKSIVVVALAPSTIVQFGHRTVSVEFLRKGMWAETMRIDDGAAVRVRASLRP